MKNKLSQNCITRRSSVEFRNQTNRSSKKNNNFLFSRSITFNCGGCVLRARGSISISTFRCEYEIKWDKVCNNHKAHLVNY
jgi:hypothetical protein